MYVDHPHAAFPYTDVYTTSPKSIMIPVSGYAAPPPVKPILPEGLGHSNLFIEISLSGSADVTIKETHSYINAILGDVHDESWDVADTFSMSFSGLIPTSGALRLSGQVNISDSAQWWWAEDDQSAEKPWQVPYHRTSHSQIAPFGNQLTLSQNITGAVTNQPIA